MTNLEVEADADCRMHGQFCDISASDHNKLGSQNSYETLSKILETALIKYPKNIVSELCETFLPYSEGDRIPLPIYFQFNSSMVTWITV